jgi:hypothetical protein
MKKPWRSWRSHGAPGEKIVLLMPEQGIISWYIDANFKTATRFYTTGRLIINILTQIAIWWR